MLGICSMGCDTRIWLDIFWWFLHFTLCKLEVFAVLGCGWRIDSAFGDSFEEVLFLLISHAVDWFLASIMVKKRSLTFRLNFFCTPGGTWTPTPLLTADFESTASTIPPPGQIWVIVSLSNRMQNYNLFFNWQNFFCHSRKNMYLCSLKISEK